LNYAVASKLIVLEKDKKFCENTADWSSAHESIDTQKRGGMLLFFRDQLPY
jgi:hypothetical protein